MADFFNSINGYTNKAKDIIASGNKDIVDEEEKEYNVKGSFDFDGTEDANNDYFAITESEEYEFDFTKGEDDTPKEEVQENPFL